MSGMDRAKNKAEHLVGKAKEAVGKVTDDKGTRYEGKADQVKANLKDAGEKARAAVKKYGSRHRGKPGDRPGGTSDGPAL